MKGFNSAHFKINSLNYREIPFFRGWGSHAFVSGAAHMEEFYWFDKELNLLG